MRRAWLIAEREFRAYAGTATFWIAVLATPLMLGGAVALAAATPRSAPEARLTLTPAKAGGTLVTFSAGFPAAARARLLAELAKDPAVAGPVSLAPPPKPQADAATLSRFVMTVMLWAILVGSLGMLLQATVRERSNRALESLLAAAHPWDVVAGKLAGVGAVSVVVLLAWLGSSTVLAALGGTVGPVAGLLHGLAQPQLLARAALIYPLAFAVYGFATIAIGASARDNAQAQNLARPMFVVLLAVFFVAMSLNGGANRALDWLVYVPPFTPFLLLMSPHAPAQEALALTLLAAAAVGAGWAAVRTLRVSRTPWSELLTGLRRA